MRTLVVSSQHDVELLDMTLTAVLPAHLSHILADERLVQKVINHCRSNELGSVTTTKVLLYTLYQDALDVAPSLHGAVTKTQLR